MLQATCQNEYFWKRILTNLKNCVSIRSFKPWNIYHLEYSKIIIIDDFLMNFIIYELPRNVIEVPTTQYYGYSILITAACSINNQSLIQIDTKCVTLLSYKRL